VGGVEGVLLISIRRDLLGYERTDSPPLAA